MTAGSSQHYFRSFIVFPIFLGVIFACNLGERIRLDRVIGNTESIRDAELKFRAKNKRFGNLRELVDERYATRALEDGEDAGYIFDLKAEDQKYVLIVTEKIPDNEQNAPREERLSFYLDETGTIRGSVDQNKIASKNSDPINPK